MVRLPLTSSPSSCVAPTLICKGRLVPADVVLVMLKRIPWNCTAPLFQVSVSVNGGVSAATVPTAMVLAPAKVCAPVVTKPRLVAEALGILKVCVDVTLLMLKSVPLVPVASVCVAALRPLSEVSPVAPAAHVPSPRQNVDELAPVPLFRFPTGRLPVTSV